MDTSIKSFNHLIKVINESAGNIQRDRGTYFEQLVQIYLQKEPIYKNLYSDVWQLKDVPKEYGISKRDTGVDLVARNRNTGELTAIQAKFYKGKVGKAEINSFIAELGKSYYSAGMIVSTTDEWNQNALDTVDSQTKQVQKIGLSDLRHSKVDWSSFDFEKPKDIIVKSYKKTRDYQEKAIVLAKEYFKNHDRGMLIMAPGTGKTFTSLKMVEQFAKDSNQKVYNVLYLVPSIQLLTQTLFGWNGDISDDFTLNSFAVTSDRKATKKKANDDDADILATDIGFPATTNVNEIVKNYRLLKYTNEKITLNVIFSTYQSIDVIHQAQDLGYPEFDFIVSDEAHRTTGFKEQGQEDSTFTKVHSNANVKGKLRLYQTATPKIYSDVAKSKGVDKSVVISSMDDESIFGTEIFRLGFGEAVGRGYLTDYKVMVLTVEEEAMTKNLQKTLADSENGLNLDDVGRIVGVWNGMIKREGATGKVSGQPMKRAISFTDTIANSKKIAEKFNNVVNEYLGSSAEESFQIDVRHVDGTLNALQKKEALDWLAGEIDSNEARVLSNVKFLTEGIDVPNLDGVIFFAPKKSQVDIVQAVGRIMRKFEGKEYGYIILPIVVPAGVTPENVLDDNKTYAAVWQVLNALRSTDERFNAIVNQLQLNKKKPDNINIINPGKGRPRKPYIEGDDEQGVDVDHPVQTELQLWDDIQDAIFGKIVQKVGDRRYLEDWSKDVNEIAQRYIRWVNERLEDKDNPIKTEFTKFVYSLQHNINESITQESAVEMLAQHLITKPVFEALFDEYSFVHNNPVSQAMENIVIELQKAGFEKEQEKLAPFYESVKLRASGVDNAEGKQKIIITLYDKFFSTGFKSTTDRLGIVFTPIEVVDFIVKSVDDVLNKHFGKSLASEGVHILDPFTGTGTFIVRTLTYLKDKVNAGEITLADITHKFTQELHANEIVLLSYYIAAINIEATFVDINSVAQGYGYTPFEGIVLTDTFESTENEDTLDDTYFGINDERLKRQQEVPITAIIGNPPYSAKQDNEDGNQARYNYPILDASLRTKWIETSTATNKNGLLDSYIRAMRWSANRIKGNGIIGFITNSSFVDGVAMDGMRKSLLEEFSDVYIIDLKGQIRRRSKDQAKIEGGNIFDIMTGVAITLFVKDEKKSGIGSLHYLSIGDSLSKNEKLFKLTQWERISNIIDDMKIIIPNDKGDWINQRNSNFDDLIEIVNKRSDKAIFIDYTGGIKTGRDAWSWGFNSNSVKKNTKESIDYYNDNLGNTKIYSAVTNKLSWTLSLKQKFERKEKLTFDEARMYVGMYRPFTKKYVYYTQALVDRQYQMSKVLPVKNSSNLMISLSNKTEGKQFTTLFIDVLPDVNLFAGGSQNIPQKLYDDMGSYSAIRPTILEQLPDLNEQDAMYYIYGVFHSKEFATNYFDDLAKSFPRLPNLRDKEKYIEIGRKLADLHLNYENQPSWDGVEVQITGEELTYRVKKMKHPKKGVLDTIIFNESIVIKNIPEVAYDYVVNGRSAIEWIIDQYQVKTDKKSGITDDPNEFSEDPKYILNLLLSVITVSMKTIELVGELPKFEVVDDSQTH
ncbi:DEAD/DEAH box helicase family protein [Metaplanococcus flavidus]